MARRTKSLTNTEVKAAKATEKPVMLYDGDGLELLVNPSGSKLWRFRYYKPTTKKRAMISFGAFPAVTLAEARQCKDDAKALLSRDIDPAEHKAKQREMQLEASNSTFSKVALDWFELKKTKGLEPGTLKDIWRSLERAVLPELGDQPISSLTAKSFINVLKPIDAQGKADTVRRLAQRINEVMDYAVNADIIPANPAAKINRTFSAPVVRHMPAIRPEELPGFMRALSVARVERQTRLVIEWQLLMICRPNEAARARWDEIDLDAKEWRLPAGRMKQRREHVIPINNQAMGVLDAMRPISGHREFIFPHYSDPQRPMNEQTANAAIKRMGYGGKLVAHGLRSVASTAMNEQGFPPDVIEAALSHIDKDEVRRAYNRSTYLEQRRPLMTWWGDFVERAATGHILASDSTRGLRVVGE